MIRWREEKVESASMFKEKIAERSQFLAKWISILFWLIIPSALGALLSTNILLKNCIPVYIIGTALSMLSTFICGVILLKLSSVEKGYRSAGICILIYSSLSLLDIILTLTISESIVLALYDHLIAIPVWVLLVIGSCQEFKTHAYVLLGVNDKLANKWLSLFKWFIGCVVIIIVSEIFGIITLFFEGIPFRAIIIILDAILGIMVITFIRLIYLYQTAKTLKQFN